MAFSLFVQRLVCSGVVTLTICVHKMGAWPAGSMRESVRALGGGRLEAWRLFELDASRAHNDFRLRLIVRRKFFRFCFVLCVCYFCTR